MENDDGKLPSVLHLETPRDILQSKEITGELIFPALGKLT